MQDTDYHAPRDMLSLVMSNLMGQDGHCLGYACQLVNKGIEECDALGATETGEELGLDLQEVNITVGKISKRKQKAEEPPPEQTEIPLFDREEKGA